MEEWRDIKGYEGLYQVSNYGRVKSLDYNHTGEERILKPVRLAMKSGNAYYQVHLCKDGKTNSKRVHRLVAQAFIPNPNGLPDINHKDENGLNNRVDNLEWCTHKYNCNYGTRNGRIKQKMINGKTSKPVYQYSIDGKLIKEWTSLNEIERQTGYSCAHICKCCSGERKTAYGYKWSYCLSL